MMASHDGGDIAGTGAADVQEGDREEVRVT